MLFKMEHMENNDMQRPQSSEPLQTSQPSQDPQSPKMSKPNNEVSRLQMLVVILAGLVLGGGYYLINEWNNDRAAKKKAAEEARRPHLEMMAKIAAFKAQSKELPGCPLIFPLTNEKGEVTPLGSYLSYFAMKRATYLPQSVFRIPNAGSVFAAFALFDEGDNQWRKVYRQELPFRFGTKDFGEGHLVRVPSGYRVQLRFWGTHEEKKFQKVFKNGELNQAPTWMAQCLHLWIGFTPTEAQKAYLGVPDFKSDADIIRAASVEAIIRTSPQLVMDWDEILAKNPENPYLVDRWVTILDHRDGGHHFELIAPLIAKSPDDSFLLQVQAIELNHAKKYDEALTLLFKELERDDNNDVLYGMAAGNLQEKGFWEESIELLNVWCQKHPENPEPWMQLSDAWKGYAWEARGSGWASTVTKEGRRLFKERIPKAYEAANKASEVAPQDCRTWASLVRMGTGCGYEKEKIQGLFEKAIAINPYRLDVYQCYWNYLQPRWYGSEEEMWAFARKYKDRFPSLITSAGYDAFWVYADEGTPTIESRKKQLASVAENVKKSGYWPECEEAYREELRRGPYDLSVWTSYCYWGNVAGRKDAVLDYAKELAGTNPFYRAIPPSVALIMIEQEELFMATHAEQGEYEKNPEVHRIRAGAYRDLIALDLHHWWAWNCLAKQCVADQQLPEAKKAFEAIGDHWIESVWPRKEFDSAKKQIGI